MHFIPARPTGDLRLLDEAIGIAIIGHPAMGMIPVDDGEGATVDRLRIGRNLTAIGWTTGMVRARDSLLAGLKAAEIQALVQSRETGQLFQVPRAYWFSRDLTVFTLELDRDDPSYLQDLDGQPLIVDASQQESWSETARPAHKQMNEKAATSLAGSEGKATPTVNKPVAVLPPSASNADRRNERAAHAAAAKVRSGLSIEAAAREVADMVEPANRKLDSIVAGIRRAYNLMYDKRGNPLRIDQN